MAPKHESNGAGNLDVPKRSLKMFPLRERYKCTGEKTWCIQGLVLFAVSGIHWESWDISPTDKGQLLCGQFIENY